MGVEIQLSDNWFLLSDERQWILAQPIQRKGVQEFRHKYFFVHLKHLLVLFVELRLRTDSNAQSLSELLEDQKTFSQQLTHVFQQHLPRESLVESMKELRGVRE